MAGRRLGHVADHVVRGEPHEHQDAHHLQPRRLEADEHAVVLYRFDEGSGDACREACSGGDPALTLRAHKRALWRTVDGFGPVIAFERGEANDDANVLVGPVDHDALELRRCPQAYTVEAWVRYTGPWGAELGGEHPRTTAQICGTDEDGFSLPSGQRSGWSFSLAPRRHERRAAPGRAADAPRAQLGWSSRPPRLLRAHGPGRHPWPLLLRPGRPIRREPAGG